VRDSERRFRCHLTPRDKPAPESLAGRLDVQSIAETGHAITFRPADIAKAGLNHYMADPGATDRLRGKPQQRSLVRVIPGPCVKRDKASGLKE
jgi:hypothetical protein